MLASGHEIIEVNFGRKQFSNAFLYDKFLFLNINFTMFQSCPVDNKSSFIQAMISC